MASASSGDLKQAITEFLVSNNVPPKAAWLAQVLPSIRTSAPLPASQKTALFRLLSTDLTVSMQPSPSMIFPPDVSDPQHEERRLRGPLTVQVLDIEDIGHSRWSQAEDLDAHDRGEMTKGREVIRVITDDSNEAGPGHNASPNTVKSGPHKLLIQDAAGTQCFAFDMNPLPQLNIHHIAIGTKLVLRDVSIARGVALLGPGNVQMLGGKVDDWDKKWRVERKEMLKRKAELGSEPG